MPTNTQDLWFNQLGLKVSLLPKVLSRYFHFNTKWKDNEYIGTEFEVEGYNLPSELSQYWNVTSDPSLRAPADPEGGAYEYVAKKPVSPDFFKKKSLPYLTKHLTKGTTTTKFSLRCSTHVHLGVHSLYFYQVFLLAGLYHIIEDVLWPLLGERREGFLFCVGASTSKQIPASLVEAVRSGYTKVFHQADCYKYTSLNLKPLTKLGTIEFRGMEGTIDNDRLCMWIDILDNLRSFASKVKPDEAGNLLNIMSANGPLEFFKSLVGEEPYKYLMKLHNNNTQHVESLLYEGINNMQALFYEPEWGRIKRVDELPDDLSVFTGVKESTKKIPHPPRPDGFSAVQWQILCIETPKQAWQTAYNEGLVSHATASRHIKMINEQASSSGSPTLSSPGVQSYVLSDDSGATPWDDYQ